MTTWGGGGMPLLSPCHDVMGKTGLVLVAVQGAQLFDISLCPSIRKGIGGLHVQGIFHGQAGPDLESAHGTRRAVLMGGVLRNINKDYLSVTLHWRKGLTYCKLICWNLHSHGKIILKL